MGTGYIHIETHPFISKGAIRTRSILLCPMALWEALASDREVWDAIAKTRQRRTQYLIARAVQDAVPKEQDMRDAVIRAALNRAKQQTGNSFVEQYYELSGV